MAKKLIGKMKLQIKAGQANPSPPVGPALGQRGLNIMEFCKQFNAKTADLEPGSEHHGVLQAVQRQDRRSRAGFALPDDHQLLPGQVLHDGDQDAAGVLPPQEGGRQVRQIAEAKMKDLSANDIEAAMQIILGSARSIGIEVKG